MDGFALGILMTLALIAVAVAAPHVAVDSRPGFGEDAPDFDRLPRRWI